jgi:hypothetical protein
MGDPLDVGILVHYASCVGSGLGHLNIQPLQHWLNMKILASPQPVSAN